MLFLSRRPHRAIRAVLVLGLLLSSGVHGHADWLTYAHDEQRTGFNPDEHTLTPENVSGLHLLWQAQLDNVPLALSALTAPLVADHVATQAGLKSLVLVAGTSDTFFAVDATDGKVIWNRTFQTYGKPKDESFYLCPNPPNVTPVVDPQHQLVYTIASDGRLYGLDLTSGTIKFGPFVFLPPYAKAWSLNLHDGALYTTTSQSCGGDRSGIYSMQVGHPLRTESHELVVRKGGGGGLWLRGGTVIDPNGTVYVSSGDGAFDPSAGDYSNTFLSAPADLSAVRDYFAPENWKDISKRDLDLPSGGLAEFTYRGRRLLTGGGKESVVYVLDAENLGGPQHSQPLHATAAMANAGRALEEKGMWGSPAVWSEADGTTWIAMPVWGAVAPIAPPFAITNGATPHGSLLAFKLTGGASGPIGLEPAWMSPDMSLPDAPIVANGIVYALSTGENPRQDHRLGETHFKSMQDWKDNLLTTAERGQGTHPAVLMALDAKTGKLLYQSGDSMKTWVHFTGLAVSGGRVYAVDHESRLYCFGVAEPTP